MHQAVSAVTGTKGGHDASRQFLLLDSSSPKFEKLPIPTYTLCTFVKLTQFHTYTDGLAPSVSLHHLLT